LKAFGAAALIAIVPAALAQNLPAGISGYWKITKMHPKKPAATPSCTANPAFFSKTARGTRVLMSDRNFAWGSASATDPAPRVSMVDPADFSAHHSQAGVTLHELALDRGSKIEMIKLGAPGTLPFEPSSSWTRAPFTSSAAASSCRRCTTAVSWRRRCRISSNDSYFGAKYPVRACTT
jgi:hypothetical protein